MKKLLVFLLCASLAVLITACGHPSLKTQSAAAQPEQTQQPHNQTEQQSVDEEHGKRLHNRNMRIRVTRI